MASSSFTLHCEEVTKFQVQDYSGPCLAIGDTASSDGKHVYGDVCLHMTVDRLRALADAVNTALATTYASQAAS